MNFVDIIGTSCHATVDSLLDGFHAAASKSSLKDYFGCFSAHGTFLGTDPCEYWSVEEFFEYAKPYFLSGQGWTYQPKEGTRKVRIIADKFATFDELLDSKDFSTSRGSGSLIFDDTRSCWLIASYHLTFPIPNALAVFVCKAVDTFEKESKGRRAEDAAATAAAEFLKELELEDSKQAQAQQDKQNNQSQPSKSKKKSGKKGK